MSMVSGAWSSTDESGPSRDSLAQSRATSTRPSFSGGAPRSKPSRSMNEYSVGSGASPYRYISLSLPSASSASFAASSDPSASPSGFSCVTSRKRSFERSASETALRSSFIAWRELVDQLTHADAALDRRIVFEGQLGSPLHFQLPGEAGLKNAVGRGEPVERLVSLPRGPEDTDEDRGLAQIGRSLDAGDRHEADPRILQLPHRLRDHLANGLVDAAHPVAHTSSSVTTSRSSCPSSNAWPARNRSAPSRSCSSSRCPRATHESVSRERCQSSWWSTSATDAPNRRCSWAFTLRSSLRLPFREPFSGKCSSHERMPT